MIRSDENANLMRNAASQTVLALRKALGKTQQAFATEIAKTAITTVARWETGNPAPRGEVLLRLAQLADENGELGLRDDFKILFADEIIGKLGNMMVVPETSDRESHGYIFEKLRDQREVDEAIKFEKKLDSLRGQGDDPNRAAMYAMLSGRRGLKK